MKAPKIWTPDKIAKFNSNLVCRKCKSPDVHYYHGMLGYEAMKCAKCGTEHTAEYPMLRLRKK